jgi:hypothetical protein
MFIQCNKGDPWQVKQMSKLNALFYLMKVGFPVVFLLTYASVVPIAAIPSLSTAL